MSNGQPMRYPEPWEQVLMVMGWNHLEGRPNWLPYAEVEREIVIELLSRGFVEVWSPGAEERLVWRTGDTPAKVLTVPRRYMMQGLERIMLTESGEKMALALYKRALETSHAVRLESAWIDAVHDGRGPA